jgi:hypothetical protein
LLTQAFSRACVNKAKPQRARGPAGHRSTHARQPAAARGGGGEVASGSGTAYRSGWPATTLRNPEGRRCAWRRGAWQELSRGGAARRRVGVGLRGGVRHRGDRAGRRRETARRVRRGGVSRRGGATRQRGATCQGGAR